MADANINIGVNVNSKSIAQLETELSKLNAKIKSVAVGSAEFTKLSSQIQTVQKSIEKANASIKGFNPEETFGRLAKVAGGVGAAFAAANLFIGENEDATKAAAKAQEALVAVLGLSQVAEAALAAFQLARTNALVESTKAFVKNATATKLSAVEAEFAAGAYATEAEALTALTAALAENAIVEQKSTIETVNSIGKFDAVIKEASSGAVVAGAEFDELTGKLKLVGKAGEELSIDQVGKKLDYAKEASKGFGETLKDIGKSITAFVTSTGFIVGAIAAVAAALFLYAKSVSDADIATAQFGVELETLGKTVDDISGKISPTIKALTIYNSLLKSGSLTVEERTKYEGLLRKELEKQGLTQTEVNSIIRKGVADIDAYVQAILRQTKAIAVQEELVNTYKEIFKIQADISKSAPGIGQSILNFALSQGDLLKFRVKQLQSTAENYTEQLDELEKKAQNLEEILKGTFETDPAAAAQGKKELDNFLKGTEDSIKKAATDISAFLKQVRDERVKAELEGRAEEVKAAQNATADQLEELRKQRDEFLKDETLTAAQKKQVEENYQAGVVAITKNGKEQVAEINRTYDQRELDRKKANLDARIALEEQALDTEVQLYTNANEVITRTEVDALKQREGLLQKQLDIDLRRAENLRKNFEEQKKQLEEAKKLAKPEDQQAIQNQIDALIANFEKQLAAITGAVLKSQNELVQTGEQIVLAGITKETQIRETEALKTIKGAEKRNAALKQIAIDDVKARLKVAKEGSDEQRNLQRQLAELELNDIEAQEQRKRKLIDDSIQFAASAFNQLIQSLRTQADLQDLRFAEEIERVTMVFEERSKLIDKEEKKLDDLEQAKQTNLTKTERKRIALAKERAALEAQQQEDLAKLEADRANASADAAIQQANLQFALSIGEAVVNAAVAIGRQYKDLPLPAAIPASLLTAGLVGVQVAAANSARSLAIAQAEASRPRQVTVSGRVSKAEGGLITGPGNGVSDSVPANLSTGEFVVNANATQKYLPLLSALNASGLQGGNPVNPGGNNEMVALLQEIKTKLSEPNRAYVVATDIEDIQNKQNYINRRSNAL